MLHDLDAPPLLSPTNTSTATNIRPTMGDRRKRRHNCVTRRKRSWSSVRMERAQSPIVSHIGNYSSRIELADWRKIHAEPNRRGKAMIPSIPSTTMRHTTPFMVVPMNNNSNNNNNNNNTGSPLDQPLPRMARVGSPVFMSWVCVYVVTTITLLLCGEAPASSSMTVSNGRQEQERGLASHNLAILYFIFLELVLGQS
eukprot:scaffold50931_cov33-Attheya_sp.AAC.1